METRVEDLFSNAVERQVAERRAVGRALEELGHLVKALDDRLGRVEEAETRREGELRETMTALAQRIDGMSSGVGDAVHADVAGLTRELDDRLARLEAADESRDRDLREAVESINDHVEALTARVQNLLGEGIDQLGARQSESTQALERAVLSAAAEQQAAMPDVDALATGLASRLAPPAIDVDALASDLRSRLEAPSVDVDALAADLRSRLEAPSIDVDDLARRVSSLLTPPVLDTDRLAAGLAERLAPPVVDPDAIADVVAGRVSTPEIDVDEVADLLAVRLGRGGPDPEELASQLADRVVAASPPLDVGVIAEAVVGRLAGTRADVDVDAIAAAVAGRMEGARADVDVDAIASAVARRVEESGPSLDEASLADAVVRRLAETSSGVDEATVANLVAQNVPSALQVASAVDASIRDGLVSVVDDIRDEIDRLREDVGQVRGELGETVGSLQPLSSRMGAELDAVTDAVEAIRADLRRAGDDRDRLAEVVRAELAGAVDGPDRMVEVLRTEMESMARERQALLDEVEDRVAESLTVVEQKLGGLDNVGVEFGDHVASLRTRFDELSAEVEGIRGIADTLANQSASMDRLAIELPGNVTTAIDARAEDLNAELSDLVREFATEIGTALATVAERVEDAQATTGQTLGRVDEQVAAVVDDVAALREDVAKDTENLTTQAAAIDQMASDVAGLGDTIGRVMGEVQVDLEARQDESIQRLHEVLADARERVEDAARLLEERTASSVGRVDGAAETVVVAADGLRERLEASLDDISSATRIDAEAARDEVVAAGARLDLLFDRLAGFERAVIEHLEARDNQLARERQLVTEALVEQLATSMSKGQRKRLAKNVEVPMASQVAARETTPPPVAPTLTPRTPEPGTRDVELEPLAEAPAAERVVPKSRAAARPKGSTAAKPTRARKPSTKKATAGKATAKKAVAKKPAAKAAPKKAAAKKATAKKAAKKATKKATAKRASTKKATPVASGLTRQDLIDVKGLGPAKADALLAEFGTPAAVAKASVERLSAVPGISERLAKKVRDELG